MNGGQGNFSIKSASWYKLLCEVEYKSVIIGKYEKPLVLAL